MKELSPSRSAVEQRASSVVSAAACFSCGSRQVTIFYEVEGVPVNSCLLIPSRNDALSFPKGDLRLTFCQACGFIFNSAFDPSLLEYSTAYEETQGFSPRFQEFARGLAGRLIHRHGLNGKSILEIGCGKGEFLTLLCEMGGNRGVGIDPAYVEGRLPPETAGTVSFIQDFYSEAYSYLTADFIVCRHTLEHIQDVRGLVTLAGRSIRDNARDGTVVFFEVPDVVRVLREVAFWDLYYEHCSYFSLGSLARLFRSCGFTLLDLDTDFDDQYLLLEASLSGSRGDVRFPSEADLEALAVEVEQFSQRFADNLEEWRDDLRRFQQRGQRVVLWGAGSKAVAYLTTLGIHDEVEYLVDVNPFKHGKYIAGTGHEVVAPRFMQAYQPDVVIAMNPIYHDEIRRDLDAMGLHPQLICL